MSHEKGHAEKPWRLNGQLPLPPVGRRLLHYAVDPLLAFREYKRVDFVPDLVAGLTVATFAVPHAMALATIAELPPKVGLYTAAVAAIVGSLWGSSRYLATGPTNAISLLVLSVLLSIASPGSAPFLLAASTVAVLAGLFLIGLSMLHMGALVTLASRSVLLGFTFGAAVLIGLGQLRHLLRIEVPGSPELIHVVGDLISRMDQAHLPSLGLGLGSLALLLLLRKLSPRLPAALIALSGAALCVWLMDLEAVGVQVVGALPRSLPPLTWSSTGLMPDAHMTRSLMVGALAVTALGLIEAVAIAQSLAREKGDRVDNNQEFFGQGLANIMSGLFSGYACSGSFARSALAKDVGARTRLTGVITGIAILVAMLLFAPFAAYIPRASLAAVLVAVAWRMVERDAVKRVLRTSRSETVVLVATLVATLVLPLEFAILAGILLALAFFVIKASLPRVYEVVPDKTYRHFVAAGGKPTCPQVAVVAIQGPLFFGAVHHLEEVLEQTFDDHKGQSYLLLRMHGVETCDISGIELLEGLVKRLRQVGGDLFLVRPRQPVVEVMESSGFLKDTLGYDHILPQEGAIEHLFERIIDPAVCIYECENCVFSECKALEKHLYGESLPPVRLAQPGPDRLVKAEDFRTWQTEQDAVVVDLREPSEFEKGHVPGSRLLPLRVLIDQSSQLPKDRPVLLVCRSGRRGHRASSMLHALGFDRVHRLHGGFLAWRAANLPIAFGPDLGGES